MTEDICEFQRAMLFIQKKDARIELSMGDYRTDKYEMENPDHELAQYERQQDEANRLIQNYRNNVTKTSKAVIEDKKENDVMDNVNN